MKSIALLVTQSPFSDSKGHDALDMALVLGSFEIPTALFFVSSGVNHLRTLQPDTFNVKDFTKSFSALPFYDVEDLWVCREDLQLWSIDAALLGPELRILSKAGIQKKLAEYDRIIRF